jgi:hypothetical protein
MERENAKQPLGWTSGELDMPQLLLFLSADRLLISQTYYKFLLIAKPERTLFQHFHSGIVNLPTYCCETTATAE